MESIFLETHFRKMTALCLFVCLFICTGDRTQLVLKGRHSNHWANPQRLCLFKLLSSIPTSLNPPFPFSQCLFPQILLRICLYSKSQDSFHLLITLGCKIWDMFSICLWVGVYGLSFSIRVQSSEEGRLLFKSQIQLVPDSWEQWLGAYCKEGLGSSWLPNRRDPVSSGLVIPRSGIVFCSYQLTVQNEVKPHYSVLIREWCVFITEDWIREDFRANLL